MNFEETEVDLFSLSSEMSCITKVLRRTPGIGFQDVGDRL